MEFKQICTFLVEPKSPYTIQDEYQKYVNQDKYDYWDIIISYDGGTTRVHIEWFGVPKGMSYEEVLDTAKTILR